MIAWAGYRADGGMRYETRARWIPGAGISYHVGVDGPSLPLIAMICVLFLACALYAWRETRLPDPGQPGGLLPAGRQAPARLFDHQSGRLPPHAGGRRRTHGARSAGAALPPGHVRRDQPRGLRRGPRTPRSLHHRGLPRCDTPTPRPGRLAHEGEPIATGRRGGARSAGVRRLRDRTPSAVGTRRSE